MSKKSTTDITESCDISRPFAAWKISPSGKREWVGNYTTQTRATQEARIFADRSNRT